MMSKMPKWMADAMESMLKQLYFNCEIIKIETWNSEILKIYFKTQTAVPPCKVGDAVSIRVSDTQFRNYTAVIVPEETNVFYILFHLHSGTLGNDYIENLKMGDTLKMVVPRGRSPFDNSATNHVVITDETGLGFAFNITEECRNKQHNSFVISENHPSNTAVITDSFNPCISVKKGQVIQALELYFKDYFSNKENTRFYLIGNAKTIQQSILYLKKKGITSKSIYSQPFWAIGKKGL